MTEVDPNRNRIALSMRANPEMDDQRRESDGGGGGRNNDSLGGIWFDQTVKKGK